MLNFYFNRSNRELLGLVKQVSRWCLILTPAVALITSSIFNIHIANAQTLVDNYSLSSISSNHPIINGSYLLDKTITWADGTTEHVQIGNDGYFRLNGVKRNLVGIELGCNPPYGYQIYSPDNLAFFDKELGYLQSQGIRIVHMNMLYVGWDSWTTNIENERMTPLLDLFYKHKMLVLPEITGKWMPNFDNLDEPNFTIDVWTSTAKTTDTMMAWADRWAKVVSRYSNVVAVVSENELDYKLKSADFPQVSNEPDQEYTAINVQSYLSMLNKILRSYFLNTPIITKLSVDPLMAMEPDIKRICLSLTDIPCFDMYSSNPAGIDSYCSELADWLKNNNYPQTGWWITEMNKLADSYPLRWSYDTDNFTTEYMQKAFAGGCSLICLWCGFNSTNTDASFFESTGDPKNALKEVCAQLNELQSPILEPLSPVTPTLALPSNNSITGNLTPILSWNNVANSVSYGVQVSTVPTFSNMIVNQIGLTASNYTIPANNLNFGSQYYWRVNAIDTVGNTSNWSATNSFTTPTAPVPNAPTALTATAVSSSQINLTWQDNSGDESNFKLERKINAGGYSVIATIPANVTSFADAALTPGTSYTYRISAASAAGTSQPSNEASAATVQLTPPATPSLVSPSNNAMTTNLTPVLSWNNVANAVNYGVQVSTVPTFSNMVTSQVGLTATNYTIPANNLNFGSQYYWRVNAIDIAGNTSNWSAVNSFTTPTAPVPNAPTALMATAISSSQINLAWHDNSSDESSFMLEKEDDRWQLFSNCYSTGQCYFICRCSSSSRHILHLPY